MSDTSSSTTDSESESSDDNYAARQPSKYVLARELNMVDETYQGDSDTDPVYALLPTFTGANRVFFIGTLTETEDTSSDGSNPYMKARIVGPTGTFYVYAGQYQPDAKAFIQDAEAPEVVAVTGKPKTFETDDGETRVKIAPEQMSTVSMEDRSRWVVDAARHTHRRLVAAKDGRVVDEPDTLDAELFDTSDQQLEAVRQAVIEALEDVTELAGSGELAVSDPAAGDADADAEADA